MIRIRRVEKWVWTAYIGMVIGSFLGAAYLSRYVEQLFYSTDQSRKALAQVQFDLAISSNLRHSLWWLDSKLAPTIAEYSRKSRAELNSFVNRPMQENSPSPQRETVEAFPLPIQCIIGTSDQADSNEQFTRADWLVIGRSIASATATVSLASNPSLGTFGPSQARVELQQRSLNNALTNGFNYRDQQSGFLPLWHKGQLLLARSLGDENEIEAIVLDWEILKRSLEASVRVYLPEVQCVPILDEPLSLDNRLATLPVLLKPGPSLPPTESAYFEQKDAPAIGTHLTHVAIWSCWALTALASGALIAGVLHLLKKRSTFVAAVTHELRTPLTSLRLYTDMLSEGMVTNPDKQKIYLHTLSREVGRLEHLVENVFALARFEGTGRSLRVEQIQLTEAIAQILPRLTERCEQDNLALVYQVLDGVGSQGDSNAAKNYPDWTVSLNMRALEQILYNVIDNACKYGYSSETPQVHLLVQKEGASPYRPQIVVRDYGPGFRKPRRTLKPFSKSVEQAAATAPGIGLGLYICQHLAHQQDTTISFQNWSGGGEVQITF